MAQNFVYKRTQTTTMKIAGILDSDKMVIYLDDEAKSLATLLSDFNGCNAEISIKLKSEEELDEPTSYEE